MMFTRFPCILLALASFSAMNGVTQAAHLRNSPARPMTHDHDEQQNRKLQFIILGEPTEKPIIPDDQPLHSDYWGLLEQTLEENDKEDQPMHSDYSGLLELALDEYEASETAKEFAELHNVFFTTETIMGLAKPSTYLKTIQFPGSQDLTDEMCDNIDGYYGAVDGTNDRKLEYDETQVMALSGCNNHVCTIPLNVILQPLISIGGVVSSALILKLGVVLAPFTGGSSAALAILAMVGIKAGVIITNALIAKLIDHICCEL